MGKSARTGRQQLLPVDESFWQRPSSGGLGMLNNVYLVSVHVFRARVALKIRAEVVRFLLV